ncbi:sodium/glutamate symporter [Brachybacterium sp. GCM10030267]|uniref:sodium/glutamate symporter n=1 Tax=unclassified Brachybacterium TaxID=2623841 RepID=UPI0036231ACF
MFDVVPLSSEQLESLMLSIGFLGVLLLVGVLLRLLIPALRRFFIPAALIGGLIGIAAGPFALGLVSEAMNETWSAMGGILIAFVFAPMLMGSKLPSIKEAAGVAAPHVLYSYLSTLALVGASALMCVLLLTPVFGTHPLAASLLEISWPGGHGTAAGMAPVFEQFGWQDGSSLALGLATFGLIFGIFGGMVLLNIASRRGQLRTSAPGGDQAGREDLLVDGDGEVQSVSRLHKASLDNLAFHFSLIMVAILIGWALKALIDLVFTGVPLFPLAMIGGLLVQLVIQRTALSRIVDRRTFNQIAGIALDFLVVAAVASIQLPVLLENLAAIVVLTVVAIVISVVMFYVVGPRLFRTDWVENSIVNFGAMTGVSSVGLMLLRAADPGLRTKAGEGFALRAPFSSPFVGGGLVTALVPVVIVQFGNLAVGLGCVALCAALLLVAKLTGLWRAPAGAVRTAGSQATAV